MCYLNDIFEKAGHDISMDLSSPESSHMRLQFLRNADGSIRWIWPAHLKEPLFLKFYNIAGHRAKLFATIVRLIFLLGLQRLFFKTIKVSIQEDKKSIRPFSMHSDWALFMGTPGPNRKSIFYIHRKFNPVFLKVACTKEAKLLIENEHRAILELREKGILSFEFPKVIGRSNDMIQLGDVSEGGRRNPEFGEIHLNALKSFSDKTSGRSALHDLKIWNDAKTALHNLNKKDDSRIPKGMLLKLNTLMNSMDKSMSIVTSMSHGDFTPWNMYEKNGKLHVYDWEYTRKASPLGYDAFHFIMQHGILVNRKSWKEIYNEIREKLDAGIFSDLPANPEENTNLYLKLYLIINSIIYLDIYSRQKSWHVQIAWLLNTWNEALSDFCSASFSHRSLLVTDLFDFLVHRDYATLKFPDSSPGKLSISSDVDMCVKKKRCR